MARVVIVETFGMELLALFAFWFTINVIYFIIEQFLKFCSYSCVHFLLVCVFYRYFVINVETQTKYSICGNAKKIQSFRKH